MTGAAGLPELNISRPLLLKREFVAVTLAGADWLTPIPTSHSHSRCIFLNTHEKATETLAIHLRQDSGGSISARDGIQGRAAFGVLLHRLQLKRPRALDRHLE